MDTNHPDPVTVAGDAIATNHAAILVDIGRWFCAHPTPDLITPATPAIFQALSVTTLAGLWASPGLTAIRDAVLTLHLAPPRLLVDSAIDPDKVRELVKLLPAIAAFRTVLATFDDLGDAAERLVRLALAANPDAAAILADVIRERTAARGVAANGSGTLQ